MNVTEPDAAIAVEPDSAGLNPAATIPYGVEGHHVLAAMKEFTDFLTFVNTQLVSKGQPRLETMLMQANFSSVVGEFIKNALPRYAKGITHNRHHNGHPDLVPVGVYPNNDIVHGEHGIELKASRYLAGWQGHNPEAIWLMICVFECNRPGDTEKRIAPMPFRFLIVAGALLEHADWSFSGRKEGSRRTITASIRKSGSQRMLDNWIYKDQERYSTVSL